MALKLTWDDKNLDVDGFRIYRSDSFIQPYALPPPLTTVAPGIFEYVDETAVMNTPYHYRVGAFKGTDENVSQDRVLCNMPYTGPGPQQLLRGTWENGYFGTVNNYELPVSTDLTNPLGAWISNLQGETDWGKFVYKGKILYFPLANFGRVSIASLYKAGFLYGKEDQAKWSTYLTSTFGVIPQGATLQKGDDLFIVRLPKCRLNLGDEGTTIPDSYQGNEFDRCFARLFMASVYTNLPESSQKVNDLPFVANFNNTNGIFRPNNILTMDNYGLKSANSFLVRCAPGGPDGIGSTAADNVYANYKYGGDSYSNNWWPVLELVF